MFSDWIGNNATINEMFNIGYNDFKRAYLDKFPQMQKFFADPNAINHYIRVKNWENEGVPRDEVKFCLITKVCRVKSPKKKDSPVQQLRKGLTNTTTTDFVPKKERKTSVALA